MALQDILSAITADADKQIAALKAQHERTVAEAETKAQRDLESLENELASLQEKKTDQIKRSAHQQGEQIRRNAILQRKREILDEVYASVLKKLSDASDAEVKPLLTACLKGLSGGEIHPAKKHAALLQSLAGPKFTVGSSVDAEGGFICVSKLQEWDFRFETIVKDLLRTRTELEVTEELFSHSRA